jgi:tripartite-type tricarboxylate transporter receptor subunit TctC
VVEQAKAGRIRALAVTSTKRSSVLPDVPTLAEAGYPGIELTPWWGVFLPAGAPQPVVDKLVASFDRILAMPETTDFLTRFANEPMPGTPETLRALLAHEIKRRGELVALARIEPQ